MHESWMNIGLITLAIFLGVAILVLIVYMYKRNSAKKHSEKFISELAERKFEVTFNILWGSPGYPIAAPENPHTGNILVFVHDSQFDSRDIQERSYASPGIQLSAEYGIVDELEKEVASYKGVRDIIKMDVLNAPGSKTFTVTSDINHPLLTFVTMLAPSQDYYTTGTVNLFDHVGQCMNLYALKAGTQRRSIFVTEPKEAVLTRERISIALNGALFPDSVKNPPPIATLCVKCIQ